MKFKFMQNQTVDDISKVPTDFQHMYQATEDGTSHTINPQFIPLATSVDGMNNALQAEREVSGGLRSQVKDLEGWAQLGDSPQTVQQQLSDLQRQVAEGSKINVDEIKAEYDKQYKGVITEKDNQLQAMQTTLNTHVLQSSALNAIRAHGGKEVLLQPHVVAQTKLVEVDGGYAVRVMDPVNGTPRISIKDGNPMTVEELVLEMKNQETFAPAFASQAHSGGGTPPGGGGGGGIPPRKREDMSPNEKIAAGLNQLANG